jgi:hypothetical protein
LNNAGTISSPGTAGVYVSGGAGDSFNNSGTISGTIGMAFTATIAKESIENSGTIKGTNGAAISSSGSLVTNNVGIELTNSGLLTTAGNDAVILLNDGTSVNAVINNSGTITGILAIDAISDNLYVSNSGTIHGAVYSNHLVQIDNLGNWHGDLELTSGTITNSGNMTALISFYPYVSSQNDKIYNSGNITGDIDLTGTNSAITNHHEIYGNITMGTSDTLLNTGTIHGDVTLGASDTINDSRGLITGAINATNLDTFVYKGHFGEETINNFVATNNDIIAFGASDFGSFGAVMSATKQIGADSVITLDATDQITLVGVNKSTLTAAKRSFT